ncbi:bifunctional diguanylate cyclase/phosphodiesterase [Symbioplanes lichenis]|uniref:bifunctional diguanylate cyclase/phosphodiesterase n=1 Tax=Symbioplanes lichenis TaxID=1629072 RepID=UPI0027396A43|nr:GGDEF domain-containing protein [Actinoplanes lichenis]
MAQPDPREDPELLTPAMMIAALNQILGECGYEPVPAPAGDTACDRLIEDARRRADGIVDAARITAVEYTDAALDRAARTVLSVRPPTPVDLAPMPAAVTPGDTAGHSWLAAATAAGVYLPIGEQAAVQALDGYAAELTAAARAVPADLAAAYRIGTEVVALGIGRHEALPGTMSVVLDQLADGDTVPRPARQVAGAFAAGFAAALQARTLAQQESLHRATQRAAREYQVALQNSEARYRRLAHFDPVTGLANKSRLVQRLRQAAHGDDPARHAGLCLIELGGHAAAGEEYGTEAADHVLAEVARRLQLVARHPDYLLARHGSATFALLVEDSGGLAHVADVAERVTRMLAEPASLPGTGRTAPLLACVGVVDVPAGDLDPTRILLDAEIALRHARSGSTGWAVYDPQPTGASPRGGTSVSGLVTGPATYQPIVTLGTGRVAGLHTRVAWRHPHLGTLDLTRIGQLTGDRELTTRLAAGLLHQACRQAMQWDGPFIAVDVPVYQIGYPDAAEIVREALGASGLPPERLHLQLSGLDAVPAGSHSLIVLTALAELGVRIVLDDFGTGATSLAALRELPVHGLRTPAALLHPAAAGSDRDLLAGMARTAHALGLTLTVHGVDDDGRAATLTGTGVDCAQGVRLGAPATPHQVPGLLRRTGKWITVPGDRTNGLVAS